MNDSNLTRRLRQLQFKFIGFPLYRLARKVNMWAFRKGLKTQLRLLYLLKARIRLLTPGAKSEGYDDHVDNVIHYAAYTLAKPELFADELPQYVFEGLEADALQEQKRELENTYQKARRDYSAIKDEVDDLVGTVRGDNTIQDTLKNYLRVLHYSSTQLGNEQLSKQYLARAKELDSAVTPIAFDDLRRISKATTKQLREVRDQIADKEAVKLSLTGTGLTTVLTLISSLFIVTGYLYNRFFLAAFGIEVSKYFTLTDYLAASIEGIRYAAVGAAVGLAMFFAGYHHGSRKSYAQLDFERTQKDYTPHAFVIVTILGIVTGYIHDSPKLIHSGVGFLTMLIIFLVGPRFSRKYFHQHLLVFFSMLFVGTFVVYLYWSITSAIYRYRYDDIVELKTASYRFSDDVGLSDECLVLLASNSHYFFFRDMRDGVSVIVPADKIVSIRTIDKVESASSSDEDLSNL